jgi:hypothetical protein
MCFFYWTSNQCNIGNCNLMAVFEQNTIDIILSVKYFVLY